MFTSYGCRTPSHHADEPSQEPIPSEMPNENQVPFLDTLVLFDQDVEAFTRTLYFKPIQC